jgi:hypothetical protein
VSMSIAGPSPAASAATAKCAARVVFPAPPFWLASTITYILAFWLAWLMPIWIARKHEITQGLNFCLSFFRAYTHSAFRSYGLTGMHDCTNDMNRACTNALKRTCTNERLPDVPIASFLVFVLAQKHTWALLPPGNLTEIRAGRKYQPAQDRQRIGPRSCSPCSGDAVARGSARSAVPRQTAPLTAIPRADRR